MFDPTEAFCGDLRQNHRRICRNSHQTLARSFLALLILKTSHPSLRDS